MGPCIADVFPSIPNKMQRYTSYLFMWNALHVSGGSSAHHQKFKTVYAAWGTSSNLYCYLPLSIPTLPQQWQVAVKVWQNTRCCIDSFWAPDDGRRNHLKYVQNVAEINFVTLHLVGYTWKIHARYSTAVSALVSTSQRRYLVTMAAMVPSHLFLPPLCVHFSEHRKNIDLAIRTGLTIWSVVYVSIYVMSRKFCLDYTWARESMCILSQNMKIWRWNESLWKQQRGYSHQDGTSSTCCLFTPRQDQFYLLSAGPVIMGRTGNLLLIPVVIM